MWWQLVATCALGLACPVGMPEAQADPPAGLRQTPLPPSQKPVDFRTPRRRFDRMRVRGWTLLVERSLALREPELLRSVVARLDINLGLALQALPPSSHREIKRLTLMLLHGPEAEGGGRDNGLEFFTPGAPKHNPTLDPHMSRCVAIYSARNYSRISDLWALKALVHEFAHAHHLLRWPEDQPDIQAAWRNAMDRGLYKGVRDEDGKRVESAWATVNQLEYFAELSCMVFARCNYYPFTRSDLATYDPEGYRMILRMWDIEGP